VVTRVKGGPDTNENAGEGRRERKSNKERQGGPA
jgi:hypothetical protein